MPLSVIARCLPALFRSRGRRSPAANEKAGSSLPLCVPIGATLDFAAVRHDRLLMNHVESVESLQAVVAIRTA
jgi:hypothetical protein